MLDFSHIPTANGTSDVQTFVGTSTTAGGSWQTWMKPRGKTMCCIHLTGKGGNGGNGAVGANSTAAGGGGGGSGATTSIIMPLTLLPDILYLSLAGQSATTTLASYITTYPSVVANHTLVYAAGGGNGGNGSAGTVGTAGTAGTVAAATNMPLGWMFKNTAIAGAAGMVGHIGASIVYTAANLTGGMLVFGGTGGCGVPATATAGTAALGYAAVGSFPAVAGVNLATTATVPGTAGPNAVMPVAGLRYILGGVGGGSSHGSATTTGLFGGTGGNGLWGSGGGGGGGCLTGGVAGVGGQGGIAVAIITCW
jgi:hypothetical protein